VLAQQGVRPGAVLEARLVEGSVSLDGQVLPAGVAHHLFVSAVDEELTPLEAAPLL
jgi:DtxR family Mn-dependent transcriptional regulator